MVQEIPQDVIENIFLYNKNYISSLRSMSLVNRLWCNIGTKLLWMAPFSFCIDSSKLYKIISVYVSYLSPKSVKFLLESNIPKFPQSKTAFDYPSYLREIDVKELHEAATEWVRYQYGENYYSDNNNIYYPSVQSTDTVVSDEDNDLSSNDLDSDDEGDVTPSYIMHLVAELCKVFISRSNKIVKLSIGDISFHNDLFQDLPSYPNAKQCLSHLKILIYKRKILNGKFLRRLAKYSHNISNMIIDNYGHKSSDKSVKQLANLIEKQKSLRKFSLEGTSYDNIGLSFDKEQIRFIMRILHKSNFPNLNCLHLSYYSRVKEYPFTDYFLQIMQKVGEKLKSLTLEFYFKTNPYIIESIKDFCPNLRELSLTVGTAGEMDWFISRHYIFELLKHFCHLPFKHLQYFSEQLELNQHIEILGDYGQRMKTRKSINNFKIEVKSFADDKFFKITFKSK
ncbi:8310_t:CDS:2 [Entrophospora sp. SA101]|nr:8310_t:CDS:2 [Entrophospora sp. SA101]